MFGVVEGIRNAAQMHRTYVAAVHALQVEREVDDVTLARVEGSSRENGVRVATIDNYQGEEVRIFLLDIRVGPR